MLKKITSFILILALAMSLILTGQGQAMARDEEDLNAKADRLNSLGILKGDGKSYNLGKSLERQEAATFIVRLMGRESHLKQNKAAYLDFSFKDVQAGRDWSAPYIGYCSDKGIINGYEDGTFRPKDPLSKQAFLKTLLVAMGYEYNKDFDWDTVFAKAKLVDLIGEEEYKRGEPKTFNRGDVVVLIDRVLSLENVKTKKLMAYELLNDPKITPEILGRAGYVRLRGENHIKDIKQVGQGLFVVSFSASPSRVRATDFNLVARDGQNLEIRSLEKTDLPTVFSLKTAPMEPGKEYIVSASGILDEDGKTFKQYSKRLVSNRDGAYESPYFRISKLEPISKKKVLVYFTHPLSDQALNPENYSLYKDNSLVVDQNSNNLKIHILPDKSAVSLEFINYTFTGDGIYELRVAGDMRSDYNVRLNHGKGDTISFKASQEDDQAFKLKEIETPDNRTIRLIVNKPINEKKASQVFMYYLRDANDRPIALEGVSVINNRDNSTSEVVLKTSTSLLENKDYKLMINMLESALDSQTIEEEDHSFRPYFSGKLTYDIAYASHHDPYIVEVGFDCQMDKASVENPDYYRVRPLGSGYSHKVVAVYYNEEENLVWLYLDKELRSNIDAEYVVYTDIRIKGAMGEERGKQGEVRFTAGNYDPDPTQVEVAMDIGDGVISLDFSKPIALAVPNVLADNYQVEERESKRLVNVIGVKYASSKKMIIITEGLDPAKDYQVKIKKILEYSEKTSIKDIEVPVVRP